jgi:excisionase family DNA binding protein
MRGRSQSACGDWHQHSGDLELELNSPGGARAGKFDCAGLEILRRQRRQTEQTTQTTQTTQKCSHCTKRMERFLTLSEVRAMLKVSRATLWRWTTENGLKVVKVGNVTRIRETDLQAFLDRHESTTNDGIAGNLQSRA